MKILRIQFKNINSLRGEHEINFTDDPLKTAGLFAITGPTGSGKTTLLDVISLALYDKVPRHSEKITKGFIEKTGSILTRNTDEAYALAEYECPRGRYISKWSISTARTGKLRDYDMELSDSTTGQFLDLKKNDIPTKNEELIGLSYDQFIKSILLAQGEFSKFLKSKKDERGNLLEKITGTSIYRELGRLAFEQNKRFGQEIEDIKNRESILLEEKISEAEYEELKTSINLHKTQQAELQKQQQTLRQQIELKKDIARLKLTISDHQKERTRYTEQLTAFNAQHGEKLQRHQQLIPLGENIDAWKNSNAQFLRNNEQQQKLKVEHAENEKHISQKLHVIQELIQVSITEINALDELDHFTEKIEGFTQQINQARHDFKSLFDQANIISRSINFQLSPSNQAENIELLQQLLNESQQKAAALKQLLSEDKRSTPDVFIQQNGEQIQNLHIATEKRKGLEKKRLELEQLTQEKQLNDKLLKESPNTISHAQKDFANADLMLNNLSQKYAFEQLSKSLEEHRSTLKDGEPCPLCGALEHPYSQHFEHTEDNLEKAIQEKRKERDTLQAKVNQLQAAQQQAQEKQTKLEQQLTSLQNEIQSIEKELKQLIASDIQSDFSQKIATLDQENKQLENWKALQEKENNLTELSPLLNQLAEKAKAGIELGQQLKQLYKGENIRKETDQLKSAWNRLLQQRSFIEDQLKTTRNSINQLKEEIAELEKHLLPQLLELQYSTVDAALNYRLSENEFNQLQAQFNQLQSAIGQTQAQLKTLENQFNEKLKNDVEQDERVLQNTWDECQLKHEKTHEILVNSESGFKRQNEITQQLQQLKQSMATQLKQNKKWMLLNQYIGDAQGKNFSTFAQELTLQQLVYLANKRLQNLSNRYQLDLPTPKEDESLIIIDEHMGNMRRSVKTLSGGESFIMSLSLALALSDLASRNVDINSLFIDEGFGTLDPETLDQTLDTLEKLQAESNKTIGVISHVEALKERITTQIQINRNGQGNSSISVVN